MSCSLEALFFIVNALGVFMDNSHIPSQPSFIMLNKPSNFLFL